MAAGFPTKANWSAGDVLTAAQLDDLAATLNFMQYFSNRNPVHNSSFNFWQRGTSISCTALTTNTYNADRWTSTTGANQACTVSRQATGDTTNLPNIQYALRYQRNTGQTGIGTIYLSQSIESANSIPMSGKIVTVSIYGRAGANFSAASNVLAVSLISGTGTDQSVIGGGGFTGAATPASVNATLTTTWQRFTATGTVSALATQLGIQFGFTPTGTAGANDYFEITGIQVEIGSVASPFRCAGGSISGDFELCRYHFRRLINGADSANEPIGLAQATSATAFVLAYPLSPPMRVTPTLTLSSATHFNIFTSGGSGVVLTGLSGNAQSTKRNLRIDGAVAGSIVAGNAGYLVATSAAATIDLSSDL